MVKNGRYVSGGFFVLNRKVFESLGDRGDCDFKVGSLDEMSKQSKLMVYKHDRFWACMDTIRDAEYLNNLCNSNQANWKIWWC
jgi:glucose-1-phosphate cytidylyltransferase